MKKAPLRFPARPSPPRKPAPPTLSIRLSINTRKLAREIAKIYRQKP